MQTITIDKVDTAMSKAISEIMENAAFMEALPVPGEQVFEPGESVFYTRLPIYKPFPAMVGLIMPVSMALNLAGAMMMREYTMEDDEFEILDVLGEMANMVAGSLLTHLLPELDSFELGLPECRVISDIESGKEWDHATEFQYDLEGTTFLTTWEGR